MSISKVYLLEEKNRLGDEERLIAEYCLNRGIKTERYYTKNLMRGRLDISSETVVTGGMDEINSALKQLKIEISSDDYPEELQPFLCRRIWKSSVAELESHFIGGGEPVFAKPAGRAKIFTGAVFETETDLYHISHVSRKEPLWCAPIVGWLSEFRYYVCRGEILACAHYKGREGVVPGEEAVKSAIAAFQCGPEGYALDFGVLDTGETALVEFNDGFALGAYEGVKAEEYAPLILARWEELTS